MKTLALGLVLIFPSVVTAKPREWKNATVAAIAVDSADKDAAVMPVGTEWLGVRITTDCSEYRVETEDMIYILLDGVGQFLYSCEMRAVVFGGQNINGQGCTIKP
jgi:hypothetical protein